MGWQLGPSHTHRPCSSVSELGILDTPHFTQTSKPSTGGLGTGTWHPSLQLDYAWIRSKPNITVSPTPNSSSGVVSSSSSRVLKSSTSDDAARGGVRPERDSLRSTPSSALLRARPIARLHSSIARFRSTIRQVPNRRLESLRVAALRVSRDEDETSQRVSVNFAPSSQRAGLLVVVLPMVPSESLVHAIENDDLHLVCPLNVRCETTA